MSRDKPFLLTATNTHMVDSCSQSQEPYRTGSGIGPHDKLELMGGGGAAIYEATRGSSAINRFACVKLGTLGEHGRRLWLHLRSDQIKHEKAFK